MSEKYININDYNYQLSEDKIARYPLKERDNSKLLLSIPNSGIQEKQFSDIANILSPESLIIFNNTRVIHARITFKKKTGARIEVFCLTPFHPHEYDQAFTQTCKTTWSCMIGNLKKWKNEILELQLNYNNQPVNLSAEKAGMDEKGNFLIQFSWDKSLTFAEILNLSGNIPIPPYLNRQSEDIDKLRYQTVYSQFDGSVAAPTAGLHFTDIIINRIAKRGIKTDEITLHVGAGTFQPVKTEDARAHKMHGEQFIVSKRLIQNLLKHRNSVVAIGTTSLRTLESVYWMGVKIISKGNHEHILQWDWEILNQTISLEESLHAIVDYMDNSGLEKISSVTEIMIIPGYTFRVVHALLTNFHQPKSTLLLLVSAFVGPKWKVIYEFALNNNFRFLSYGDSSLLIR